MRRTVKKKVRAHRTNAERSAETRGKLIDAATRMLCKSGYGATTTIAVADSAQVSRGAMLHHFPTRVDLLLAVAEHIMLEQRRVRRDYFDKVPAGPERFFAGADISWVAQRQPSTLALLEIMMASRNDRDLRRSVAPLLSQMTEMRSTAAARLAKDLGITDKSVMIDFLHVHLAALRGLAIDLIFTQSPREIERARKLFTTYEHTFARSLMAAGRKKPKTASSKARK